MFSGKYDLKSVQCSDRSFFIDRDGSHFKFILDYLRGGEDVFKSFPKSADILQGLIREAKYYHLKNLSSTLKLLLCEVGDISHNDIMRSFRSEKTSSVSDYIYTCDENDSDSIFDDYDDYDEYGGYGNTHSQKVQHGRSFSVMHWFVQPINTKI